MTKTATIPLVSYAPGDGKGIGSGFIVQRDSQPWMITAAHVALRIQPTTDWNAWPAEIHLAIQGQEIGLQLFDVINGTRQPKFNRVVDPKTGVLSDFMAYPILPSAVAPGGPLSDYAVQHCPATVDMTFGDSLFGLGYPPVAFKGWPYHPPHMWHGHFHSRDEGRIRAVSTEVIGGHSGGPVFKTSGGWIGMCIGMTEQTGGELIDIVAADYICQMLVAG